MRLDSIPLRLREWSASSIAPDSLNTFCITARSMDEASSEASERTSSSMLSRLRETLTSHVVRESGYVEMVCGSSSRCAARERARYVHSDIKPSRHLPSSRRADSSSS